MNELKDQAPPSNESPPPFLEEEEKAKVAIVEALITTLDARIDAAQKAYNDLKLADETTAYDARRKFGRNTIRLASAGVVVLGAGGLLSLHSLLDTAPERTSIIWGYAAGHAFISIALVFFLYQMLRAGERMSLPHWILDKDPQSARILLGVTDPASAGQKALTEAFAELGKALAPLVALVSKITPRQ